METKNKTLLHYLYDPLCGWCYAAEALLDAAISGAAGRFEVQLHAGGLFERTQLPDAKRAFIRTADARIGEMTGQIFGEPYLQGLLSDPETIYDSAPPIRGILAAQAVKPGSDAIMLKALQRAHYRAGLRIVETPVIVEVAESIGLSATEFHEAFDMFDNNVLAKHLQGTHTLMRKVGARGYPTFVAQIGEQLGLLPHDRFYGNAGGFAELVASVFGRTAATSRSKI